MRYSSLEKCLRLVTDRTFDKPYSSRSKALFHVIEQPALIPDEGPSLAGADRRLRVAARGHPVPAHQQDIRAASRQHPRLREGPAFAQGFRRGLNELVVRVDGAAPPELPQLNEPVIAFFSYSDANNQYARTVARITGRATRRNRLRHADERTGLDLIAVLTAGGGATPATAHRAAACSCPAACTAPTRCCSAARAVKAPRPLPTLSEVVRTIHKAA